LGFNNHPRHENILVQRESELRGEALGNPLVRFKVDFVCFLQIGTSDIATAPLNDAGVRQLTPNQTVLKYSTFGKGTI
jgi:hypothetical protein